LPPRSRSSSSSPANGAFQRFFDGTGIVGPGIVAVSDRRAEDQWSRRPVTSGLGIYAAVGKKL